MALTLSAAVSAGAHELIVKPGAFEAAAGSEIAVELHSTHIFIVPEETEDVSKIKAGISGGGQFVPSEITPNEKDLRIDFSVTCPGGSSIIAAAKEGEIWSVTNEGSKSGPRGELEAAGLKVVRATMNDKYAKSVINAAAGDEKFGAVLGHDLEIVPVTNPALASSGAEFMVKILHKGQPVSAPVWATYDGFAPEYQNTYAYYTESGADGIANIKITAPGLWIVRALKENDPGAEGLYDSRSLRATLTFLVKPAK
jgi:uncharacterized GH25 family protein